MKREIITDYPNAELEKKWLEFLPHSNYPSHYTSPGFFKEPHWTNRNPFALLIWLRMMVLVSRIVKVESRQLHELSAAPLHLLDVSSTVGASKL